MAGGKETPRQKMIGMMYLVLTALLALNVSKSILDAFVAIEENIQKSNETEFYRGNEKRSELTETALDKSEISKAKKAAEFIRTVEEIDAITAKRIKEIDDLKLLLLSESKENVKDVGNGNIILRAYDSKNPLRPTRMNLDKVEGKDKYDDVMRILIGGSIKAPKGKGLDLWKSYNGYRIELVELLATYPADNGKKPYFFNAPSLNSFIDQSDLDRQLSRSFEQSNVNEDDKEALKKIYASLTKEEYSVAQDQKGVHWIGKTFDHSPTVAALASLSALQKEVLAARADALTLINDRVGTNEYSFNKIMALAYGPELANAGDDVEVQVLMAAYDSDKQPEVTQSGVKISDVRDGKGYVKAKVNGKNEMTLSGTITIRNKSGISKSMPWEKTIKIMKPSGTVSLPELNILYRGHENQINALASGYDQTILTGENVELSSTANGWIAKPKSGKSARITVKGKSSLTNKVVALGQFDFRVSNLPTPELYFGGTKNGGKISKNETRLFAKLGPEFPIDAPFEVLSWELLIQENPAAPPRGKGNQLDHDAVKMLKMARSGSTVAIRATIIGNDKVLRQTGGTFTL